MAPAGPGTASLTRAWSGLPRAVWVAAVVALALRLAFAFGYWIDKPLTHDEREYLLLARSLSTGHGFTYTALDGAPLAGEHFGRAPVYPVVLAGVLILTPGALAGAGDGPSDRPVSPRALAVIRALQTMLGAVLVLWLAAIARRTAGSRAAVAAAWLAALYPPFIWTPAFIFSETLFMVEALTLAWWLTPAPDDDEAVEAERRGATRWPGLWHVAGAGLLIGIGVLTRPAMGFFAPLLAGWLWWRRARAAVLVLSCAAVLIVLPWSIRNTVAHGRFILVASEGGITFWTGNHPLATGDGDMAANPAIKRANVAFRERHAGLNAEELEPLYYQEAMAWVRAHPAEWLTLLLRKAYFTVVPTGPSYTLHSALYRWASAGSYLSVLVLALVGLRRLGRSRLPETLLLLAASVLVMSLLFFPQERFRIPAIDPALIVLAAGTWAPQRPPSRT